MFELSVKTAGELLRHFICEGAVENIAAISSGHINDTFFVKCRSDNDHYRKYILQRINRNVFRDPVGVMKNIEAVTAWIRDKINLEGGDPDRETLHFYQSDQGSLLYMAGDDCWRLYDYIDRASCYDRVSDKHLFMEGGAAFGRFNRRLQGYPAESLNITIPFFHDTEKRQMDLKKSTELDGACRRDKAKSELVKAEELSWLAAWVRDHDPVKKLPIRVTHNDTKFNNVMIDDETGKGLCVLDLDTIMPGLIMNDFGDAIRSGASTAKEDESDLSKISCDMALFESFTNGFLRECGSILTREEVDSLAAGALIMTYESGIRFLTDYLDGDIYFKVSYAEQNLIRARNQFALVADMLKKKDQMNEIVYKCIGRVD